MCLAVYFRILTVNLEKILKTKYPDLYAWAIQPSGKWHDINYFGEKINQSRWIQILHSPPEELYKNKGYQLFLADPLYKKAKIVSGTFFLGSIGFFILFAGFHMTSW